MASRRIKRDIRHLFTEKENLLKDGTHFFPDETEMNILRAMFIDQRCHLTHLKVKMKKPYFGGYYFFLIKFQVPIHLIQCRLNL